MIFFDDIKKSAEQDKLSLIIYYGASTTSFEHVFPNWGEIMRYVLKAETEVYVSDNDGKNAYWNLQTVNFGLAGASSIDLSERFDDLVLARNPRIIFLNVGKNDVYFKIDKRITEKNTEKIIKKALAKNIKVVFTTTVPPLRGDLNKKIFDYVEVDKSVASQFKNNQNFVFVDLFELFPKNLIEKSYTLIAEANEDVGVTDGDIDPIHYNKYGNAVVAKILLDKVFGIKFDYERFLKDLEDSTKKYPEY